MTRLACLIRHILCSASSILSVHTHLCQICLCPLTCPAVVHSVQGSQYISPDALKWLFDLRDGVFDRDASKGKVLSAEQHRASEELRAAFDTFFSRCIAALGEACQVRVHHYHTFSRWFHGRIQQQIQATGTLQQI